MARMRLEFDGFDWYIEQLKKVQGNVNAATENALKETHRIVTDKAKEAIKPHRRSGLTEDSLRLSPIIEWKGDVAEVKVGFDLKKGGFPSIFLMYGTKVYGTPRIEPDKKLYNAFYGKRTKEEIREAQETAFFNEFDKTIG